jgi:TRAP-type C4-dicarboxylate transport system permease small subunit
MIRRTLDALYDAAGWLAAAFVLAVFIVMIGASAMRLMGLRTGGSDDIVAWCCAAAGFLAMAHTFRRGDFVRVTLLLERFEGRPLRALEIFSLVVAALFVAYFTWAAAQFVYESWDFHDMANGLIAIPLWIPQSSFVLGAVLLLFAVIEELVTVLKGGRPAYEIAIEERHARGDFSEDV